MKDSFANLKYVKLQTGNIYLFYYYVNSKTYLIIEA